MSPDPSGTRSVREEGETQVLTELVSDALRRSHLRTADGITNVAFTARDGEQVYDEMSFREFKLLVEKVLTSTDRTVRTERAMRDLATRQRDEARATLDELRGAIDSVRLILDEARHG